ncbi:hypothetical protein GCM10010440_71530 [Kitasatospora cinereorecta]
MLAGEAVRQGRRIEVAPGGALLDVQALRHGPDVVLDDVGDRSRSHGDAAVGEFGKGLGNGVL